MKESPDQSVRVFLSVSADYAVFFNAESAENAENGPRWVM
jgi:hypothetical protein